MDILMVECDLSIMHSLYAWDIKNTESDTNLEKYYKPFNSSQLQRVTKLLTHRIK
jgi:hypothetical protein